MIKLFQKNIKTIGERIYYTTSCLDLRLTLQDVKTGGRRRWLMRDDLCGVTEPARLQTVRRGRNTAVFVLVVSHTSKNTPTAASFIDLIVSNLLSLYKMPNTPLSNIYNFFFLLDLCKPQRGRSFFFRQNW